MSPTPRSASDDAAREEPVRPGRRPLAVRSVHELPAPRVVLHLPDLEALTSVALGPPQPTARRRVDPPHVVQAVAESEAAVKAAATGATSRGPLVNLLKMPLERLTPEKIAEGSKKLGQIAIWLQQPKMMLAAIAALALQLAAVLAMLTGSGEKPVDDSNNSSRPNMHAQHGPAGSGIVDHRHPIQTPINAPGQFSSLPPSFAPGYAGSQGAPVIVAQPAPPQTLPGVRSDELPTWRGADGPSLVGTPINGPTTTAPATSGSAMSGSTAATIAPEGQPIRATPVGTSHAKPKLKGTILKVNEGAR